jgi:hypothetical protein
MMQMTNRYSEGKGDMEGTGSNGDELQMWVFLLKDLGCIILSSGSILLAISYIEAWISFQILLKGWTNLLNALN